ncbi:pyruvate kinase [Geodermatophilus chilensis]|uniref:pyruvate kinase n=1 Tax=Geodermatophilus chilensis TaxID=2035835 RepID=UPI000C258DBC|nr:pyruvate kinase [Geodermatophilus chilensis]
MSKRLQPGDPAPNFTLPTPDGDEVSLKRLRGGKVVLYFYPAAMTPGCTKEACDFRDNLASLRGAGYTVLGVSPDEQQKLAQFREQEGLTYPLLADGDHAVCEAYGVWGEKRVNGRTVTGVIRSTFVLDEEGQVETAMYDVQAIGHVAELRRTLRPAMTRSSPATAAPTTVGQHSGGPPSWSTGAVARRAKIVSTLGPATHSYERIRSLVEAGMDVARLNFSHGSHEDHAQSYRWVRQAAEQTGRGVAVLVDLQGPKIRLGRFADGPVLWATGETVTITTQLGAGDHDRVSTTYAGLASDVAPGDPVLIDDGRVALRVVAVQGPDVRLEVIEGGTVSDSKGLSLPTGGVGVPALSDKDEADLRFGLTLGADLVALSFVRSPEDVGHVHRVMDEVGIRRPVLAKIEKPQAVAALDSIVEAFDGLMVARGDLGVEMPLERVPLVQKRAVQVARELAKPVIVATQMLESMVDASRPTRAEASDVANAVHDGADALMLSAETSVGRFPVDAVATMSRIIAAAEEELERIPSLERSPASFGSAIARSAVDLGQTTGAGALAAFTQSGDTARRLARHRSPIPLLAFTPIPEVRRQLALVWGVETFLVPAVDHTDAMVRQVDSAMLELRHMQPGEPVVVAAGSPPGTPGSTNTLRVHRLGDPISSGAEGSR